MTARELIQHALQEIGALATSEAVSNADAQASLIRLNSLLDAWQTERMTIYNLDRTAYTLVASQASYTIGPTLADWTCVVRPTFISHAAILFAASTPNVEIPMKILTDDEYAAIRIKSVESTIPTWLYYNPTYPLGTVYLYPVPSDATAQVILYIPVPLTGGLTLDSVLTLPPAYEEAIRYNLAIRLGPIFGRPIDATVGMMAVESKATLKRSNQRIDDLRVDQAIPGAGGVVWNLWTGGM